MDCEQNRSAENSFAEPLQPGITIDPKHLISDSGAFPTPAHSPQMQTEPTFGVPTAETGVEHIATTPEIAPLPSVSRPCSNYTAPVSCTAPNSPHVPTTHNSPYLPSMKGSSPMSSDNASRVQFFVPNENLPHRVTEERDQRLFRLMRLDPDDFVRILCSGAEISLDRFLHTAPQLAPEHQDCVTFKLREDTAISCVNWKGRWHITGTDIVRLLVCRFELYCGRPPYNMKKFEEGIFSDLRRLSAPHDCILEGTRSDFLVFLFDYDCVRSKKKQKVFFWDRFANVAHDIFCDAVERELARIEMAKCIGMSVDDFIKSGVVPTGTSGSTHDPLNFDWTQPAAAMSAEPTAEEAGVREPVLKVDQIHFIRNDVTQLFNRHLRCRLRESPRQTVDTPELCMEIFTSCVGYGKFISTVPKVEDEEEPIPEPPPKRFGGRRKPLKSPLTPLKTSKMKRGQKPASRPSFPHRNLNEDDGFSVSTLSSNEDEYRKLALCEMDVDYYDDDFYYENSAGYNYGTRYQHPQVPGEDSTQTYPYSPAQTVRTPDSLDILNAAGKRVFEETYEFSEVASSEMNPTKIAAVLDSSSAGGPVDAKITKTVVEAAQILFLISNDK